MPTRSGTSTFRRGRSRMNNNGAGTRGFFAGRSNKEPRSKSQGSFLERKSQYVQGIHQGRNRPWQSPLNFKKLQRWQRLSPTTASSRRLCIDRVRDSLGVSERRACRMLSQHRSTQRRIPRGREDGYPPIKGPCIDAFPTGSVVALNGFEGSPSISSFR